MVLLPRLSLQKWTSIVFDSDSDGERETERPEIVNIAGSPLKVIRSERYR